MRFGIGHGPRFHLNLFGARCRLPCINQANSSISSQSTNSSLLDNYTSSWTYIQYAQSRQEHAGAAGSGASRGSNNSSTFNDMELISLINEGIAQGQHVQHNEEAGTPTGTEDQTDEIGAATPWANANNNMLDRHTRRDVRTLFPEQATLFSGSSRVAAGALEGFQNMNDCQYVNFPLGTAESGNVNSITSGSNGDRMVPFYSVSSRTNSNSSRHSNESLRQSLGELFEFDSPSTADNHNDNWVFGGGGNGGGRDYHPYGIPSSLLGGVLLNLDNQVRLSANAEWQNWGEFLMSDDDGCNIADDGEPIAASEGGELNEASESNLEDAVLISHRETVDINRNSGASDGGDAATLCSNCGNGDNNNENEEQVSNEGDSNSVILPMSSSTSGQPQVGFLRRQFALPPPPSSESSSTRSSGSGSMGSRPRHQEWYFYDPRLVSEQRTERVTLDTSFRGLHNRCVMSSIIQPPAYDDIMNNVIQLENFDADGPCPEQPPPYTELEPLRSDPEPPPSYDQSFGHMLASSNNNHSIFGHSLAFPTFQLGSLSVNPLERRLAASLCTRPIMGVTSRPQPEPDILTDVNIDELLDGPPSTASSAEQATQGEQGSETQDQVINEAVNSNAVLPPVEREETNMEQGTSEEEEEEEEDDIDFDNNDTDDAVVLPTGEEDENNQLSLRRYPVGFCLGRRPPLRWSRGMAPNRWASSENWAN